MSPCGIELVCVMLMAQNEPKMQIPWIMEDPDIRPDARQDGSADRRKSKDRRRVRLGWERGSIPKSHPSIGIALPAACFCMHVAVCRGDFLICV